MLTLNKWYDVIDWTCLHDRIFQIWVHDLEDRSVDRVFNIMLPKEYTHIFHPNTEMSGPNKALNSNRYSIRNKVQFFDDCFMVCVLDTGTKQTCTATLMARVNIADNVLLNEMDRSNPVREIQPHVLYQRGDYVMKLEMVPGTNHAVPTFFKNDVQLKQHFSSSETRAALEMFHIDSEESGNDA